MNHEEVYLLINDFHGLPLEVLTSSLGIRPSKNRKGGSSKSAGVEVYTAPGMQVHFRLAFD